MDFSNSRLVFAKEHLDLGLATKGPSDYRFYSIVPEDCNEVPECSEDYYPVGMGYAMYDSSSVPPSFTEVGTILYQDFTSLNKSNPY